MTNRIEVSAVVFDMDGVIFDSENLCLKCWREIAAENDLGDITEEFLKCTGTTNALTRQIMVDYLGDEKLYDKFAAEASARFHMYEERDGLPVKKGVKNLLEALKESRIPVAVASSTRVALVESELRSAEFLDYFDVITGGDMIRKSKPDPDIYLVTCNRLGIEPEKCAAVEDSYNGIRSAHAAGMQAIMVPDLLPPTDEMREKSIIIAEDLDELIPLFARK